VSDSPHSDDSNEPTVRRPRLFGSGARYNDTAAPAPISPADPPSANAPQPGATNPPPTGTGRQAGAPEPQTAAPELQTAAPAAETAEAKQEQRRRRLTVIGISVGAAIVVIALCAGALGVFSAIHGMRRDAADARESRRLRTADCLELETRLNRLTPPGATTTPAARATAIQDENAAVRIYLTRSLSQRDADAWRQLVDARTAYAESLQQQAKTRTPAFFVAPRTGDGQAVADQLAQWSPAACAGPIRRLASPDL
jgi:hypothetical protein